MRVETTGFENYWVFTPTLVKVRLSYGKMAEFQARGAVHFHALLRLDGVDPADPDAILAPPAGLDAAVFEQAVRTAVASVAYRTDPHPARPQGWPIRAPGAPPDG